MAYKTLLESEELKINKKIYNVGFENHKVSYLANIVKNIIGEDVKLIYVKSDDNRSYHISSNKIQEELNFKPKLTVEDAVKDLKFAFEKNLLFDPLNNEMYFNIKRMKSINLN
jgi:nucleoside-diphosphate-sugar epimerase